LSGIRTDVGVVELPGVGGSEVWQLATKQDPMANVKIKR
jgi:hypothetical protein